MNEINVGSYKQQFRLLRSPDGLEQELPDANDPDMEGQDIVIKNMIPPHLGPVMVRSKPGQYIDESADPVRIVNRGSYTFKCVDQQWWLY